MDWTSLLKNIAPVLGTALGGPFAGIAVKAIGDALNIPSATQESIKTALAPGATPEQMMAIKNAENDFAFKMKELGFEHAEAIAKFNAEMEQTQTQDRESARQFQTEIKSNVVNVLTYCTTLAFFLCTIGTLLGYAKVDSVLAGTLIGYICADYKQIMNFHFGSSASSQNKDNLLARVRRGSR